MIYSSFNCFFSIIFRAQTKFVSFYLAKNTCPYLPEPRSFIFSKSFKENFFFLSFFKGEICFLHPSVRSTLLFLICILCFKSFLKLDNSVFGLCKFYVLSSEVFFLKNDPSFSGGWGVLGFYSGASKNYSS